MSGTFAFNFDTLYQDPFMLAFFVTVGLGASYKLLVKGGILLIFYWLEGIILIGMQVMLHDEPAAQGTADEHSGNQPEGGSGGA